MRLLNRLLILGVVILGILALIAIYLIDQKEIKNNKSKNITESAGGNITYLLDSEVMKRKFI